MLQIEPARWFSWDFDVSRDGRPVAALDISSWRERGELTIDGRAFAVTRDGFMRGDFRLESGGTVLATATKPGLFRRTFVITYSGRQLTLEPRSAWGRAVVVHEGEREVGAITPASMWSRRATATLPDTLPAPVQTFLIWLALLIWKREEDAAAAGA